jgi:hypothetical protein
MADKHENIDLAGKDYSVYYTHALSQYGKSVCKICGGAVKGHEELVEITDVVDANSMIPVKSRSKVFKLIEKKIKEDLKKSICPDCAEDVERSM